MIAHDKSRKLNTNHYEVFGSSYETCKKNLFSECYLQSLALSFMHVNKVVYK